MKNTVAAVLVILLAACGDAPAPKAVEKKPAVEPKIEAKVEAAGIDVTAKGGAVTLWGTAATDAERRRAAQIAAKVEGVKSVDNRIAVVKGS